MPNSNPPPAPAPSPSTPTDLTAPSPGNVGFALGVDGLGVDPFRVIEPTTDAKPAETTQPEADPPTGDEPNTGWIAGVSCAGDRC